MAAPPNRSGGQNGRAWKVTAVFIVVLILGLGVYAFRKGARTVRDLVDQNNRAAASIASEVVRREAGSGGFVSAGRDSVVDGEALRQARVERLRDWVRKIPVGADGLVFVVDPSGTLVAHPDKGLTSGDRGAAYASLGAVRAALAGTASSGRFRDPVSGAATIATFQPVVVDAGRWVVVASQPVASAYAPIVALGNGIALASLLIGGASLLAVWRLTLDDRERARAAGRIRESEELNRSILETAHESFVSVSAEGRVIAWNAMAERTFGWNRNEILGRKLVETFIPARYRDAHLAGFNHFLRTGEGRVLDRRLELSALHKDGREIPVELTITPLKRNDTWIFNAFLHDVTERRAAEEALRRAHDELEEKVAERTSEVVKINRDLETLIYVITHDLKEPLRAIESFGSMVQEQYSGKLDEKGRDFLRRVVRGGTRMRQLLDDLLMLTRVQQGRPAAEFVSMTDVTLEALSRLDMKVRESGAIIRMETPLPQVRADRTWVTQAVYNVLDNALKFRRDGAPPEIDIEPCVPADAGDAALGLVIKDRGPGVPDGMDEKIFQMFQRGVGREVEGTGAGLAIVRQIAERHNGRAFAKPRPGGGSEFVITFGLTEEVAA